MAETLPLLPLQGLQFSRYVKSRDANTIFLQRREVSSLAFTPEGMGPIDGRSQSFHPPLLTTHFGHGFQPTAGVVISFSLDPAPQELVFHKFAIFSHESKVRVLAQSHWSPSLVARFFFFFGTPSMSSALSLFISLRW